MSYKNAVIYIIVPLIVCLLTWWGYLKYNVCMELVNERGYCLVSAALR